MQVQRRGKMLRKEGHLRDTPLIQQLLDSTHTPPGGPGGRYSLPSYTAPPYTDILEIPTRHFAQQITAMDNVSTRVPILPVTFVNYTVEQK